MKRLLLTLIVSTFSVAVAADVEHRDVPKKLFGITLGGVYDLGDLEKKDYGDVPVKRATGINEFLGNGIHYYFQPKEASKFFKYVEKRDKPTDKYYETSFRLYLYPVIPPTIKTSKQLNESKLKWEVSLIEWSAEKTKTEKDAYFWAVNLCKTFETDISVKPEIVDSYESNLYSCTFSGGDREFGVHSFFQTVTLKYKQEITSKKDEAVEKVIRKLQANEIRPY